MKEQDKAAWIDSVMEQAQVFASAWSLIGSRFAGENALEHAEQMKAELRSMLINVSIQAAQAEPVGYWDGEFSKDGGATLYEVPQESVFGHKYRNIPLFHQAPAVAQQADVVRELVKASAGQIVKGVMLTPDGSACFCGFGEEEVKQRLANGYKHVYTEAPAVAQGEPMFWYKPLSNGLYEGPIHRLAIVDALKKSGAWVGLYPEAPAVVENETDLDVLRELAATLEFRSPERHKALSKLIAAAEAAKGGV